MGMTPPTEQQDYSWAEIPPLRRHLYFYLLLVLGTIAADSLLGTLQQSNGRLAFAPSRLRPSAPSRAMSRNNADFAAVPPFGIPDQPACGPGLPRAERAEWLFLFWQERGDRK